MNTFRIPQNTVGRFRFDPPFRRYYFEDVTFMDPLLGTPIFLFWCKHPPFAKPCHAGANERVCCGFPPMSLWGDAPKWLVDMFKPPWIFDVYLDIPSTS